MGELMQWLRALPRSIADGVEAARDLLLWGHVYPRTVDMAVLRRMKRP